MNFTTLNMIVNEFPRLNLDYEDNGVWVTSSGVRIEYCYGDVFHVTLPELSTKAFRYCDNSFDVDCGNVLYGLTLAEALVLYGNLLK